MFLLKPLSFLFIIFFACFLKRAGLFKKEHGMILWRVVMNCTLPAAIVSAFGDSRRELSLLWLVLVGLGAAVGAYFLMYGLTRRMKNADRTYYMISATGFNIGCYSMPVITAFYGSAAAVVCAMFDIGNSVMMTSGSYAFTSTLLGTEGGAQSRPRDLLRRLFSSVPMDVYLVMLVFSLIGLAIPQPVVGFVDPLADANAFLSMFMLGLLFTFPRRRADWTRTFRILAFRFAFYGALAAVMFFVLPLPLDVRGIMVLLLLGPVGSMAPPFIERCHGDGELASFTNSVSTVASLVVMSVFAGGVFA